MNAIMSATTDFDVREIDEIGDLAEFRSDWNAALAATPRASFFQTLEWLETYWKHFGADQRLRVLLIRSNAETPSIVPLVTRRESTRAGRVRVLTFPLAGWGTFYGPLGADPGGSLAAALVYLRGQPRDWDMIDLRWLGPDEEQVACATKGMRAMGWQGEPAAWEEVSLVDLPSDFEEYLASRSRKFRANLRRDRKRLEEQSAASYVHYRPQGAQHGDADPRWDLYEACENLAAQSWQGSSRTGTTLSHAAIRPFLRDAHLAAARLGALDLRLMVLGETPIAFVYGYHYRGYLYGLRSGYHAEAAPAGAGTLLYAKAIEESYRLGDKIFDLGPGSVEIKRHFRTRLVESQRLTYFHPLSARAQILRLKRWATRRPRPHSARV